MRAVLGPTNTGKTHLAIERMCGHSSGAIGFPLRLLAREVYDKVCAIKGESQVALITGEERIEPPGARYLLCTAEAMPRNRQDPGGDRAFVALDEAQLAADRERGHIFTDRLLNARGREETMLLGAATLEPLARALVPGLEVESRPRFSTLTHAGAAKLSRLPPRSAIVGFSIEQVYEVAELLKRFRGGAAVVMGALSPQTRNRQVELFQSGEVDYIVATDAIGMGLNLDVGHVAFAALAKFDGVRRRRLTPAEMAQIAGRAGRHQTDGSFGALAGSGAGSGSGSGGGRGRGESPEFTEEEVYAIEQHRFQPLTRLYWREAEPRFDSLATLIDDLEAPPADPALAAAPEAIDLAVLKRLAEDPAIAADTATRAQVRRLWEACQLPDFRQQGADHHARFVARLWRDLKEGHLGADYVAARIADLDRPAGDIDTLQGRLAAVRSWAYICQRPDWVLARDEMAARARAAEARLSDALHEKLTERFVNRRTAVLLRALGKDSGLLKVELQENDAVLVEGQRIGRLEGLRFVMEDSADSEERRLMRVAAEKHLPRLIAARAEALIGHQLGELRLEDRAIRRGEQVLATLEPGKAVTRPRLVLAPELAALDPAQRQKTAAALELWLEAQLAPLAKLRELEEASLDPACGGEVRAVLHLIIARCGVVERAASGLQRVPKDYRPLLRSMGVYFGALDVFVPALLKPEPRRLLNALGVDPRPLNLPMQPVISFGGRLASGYRRAGSQAVRVDMAEKLFRAAHDKRMAINERAFPMDLALPTSMGLTMENFEALMKDAGFRKGPQLEMAEGVLGPPPPPWWSWRPLRKQHGEARQQPRRKAPRRAGSGPVPARQGEARQGEARQDAPAGGGAFAGLADLFN